MSELTIQQDQNDEFEIDIMKMIKAVWYKKWLVAAASFAGLVLSLLLTLFVITPQYQSSVMFYVNNNSMSLGDAALSITSSDISASRGLVESYIVILNARETLIDVIDYAGIEREYLEVKDMLTAEAVNDTEIFKVIVTNPDPQEAEKIASAIAYILPKRISSIIEGSSAKIVDSAIIAANPSSPSYVKNVVIGFLMGFFLSAGAVTLWAVLDITIRTEEDITQNCKYPILAAVPDMEAPSKGGYDYSYDRDRKKQAIQTGKKPQIIGSDISFSAAEAYKLLRTKLQFSFADEASSHVIGISSSMSGEGKSVSAANLAYSLSQLGKKVILIDCDMRRPTVAEKLNLKKTPGLSNFLTGQVGTDQLIQPCGLKGDENAFYVITAGHNPPNPIELLSSVRMVKILSSLRKLFDYIILDLPPVGEVSDALAVAGQTDGVLLVVRQDRCNHVALNDTIRQFEFVDAKILGVIYNSIKEGSGKYGYNKYSYDKKYYKHDIQPVKQKTTGSFSRSADKKQKLVKK